MRVIPRMPYSSAEGQQKEDENPTASSQPNARVARVSRRKKACASNEQASQQAAPAAAQPRRNNPDDTHVGFSEAAHLSHRPKTAQKP